MNRQMEDHVRNGEMLQLANIYLDDAVLLSPGGNVVTGREAIDQYWTGIQDPIDWKLDIVLITTNEAEIYDHPYWKSLEQKPPQWRLHVNIEEDDPLVYELGHSTLTTKWNGEVHSSEVDFLLVWIKTVQGYRILADTYTW